MKKIQSIAAAMLLALFIVGCKPPTSPSFSPDGNTLVFQKGGALFLRSGGADTRIAADVAGDVAWTASGDKIAFASGQGTTIFHVDQKRSVRVPGVSGPYVWKDDLLLGMGERMNDRSVKAITIDGQTGRKSLETQLPFSPFGLHMLSDGDILTFGEQHKAYRFDGIAANPLRGLDGMQVIGSRNGGRDWLLMKWYAKPHTHRMLNRLYEWNADSSNPPRPVAILDLASAHSGDNVIAVVQEIKSSHDWKRLGAVVLAFKFSPSDSARLKRIIERYDLLNAIWGMGKQPHMSKADTAFMNNVMDRSSTSVVCLAGTRSGPWSVVRRDFIEAKKRPHVETHIAIDPAGTKMAISTEKGTQVYNLANPSH